MNVLSLFDGISCGQLALSNLGIKVEGYFASEINPHAIAITQDNFPLSLVYYQVRRQSFTYLVSTSN